MSDVILDHMIIGAGLTGLSLGWDLKQHDPALKIQWLEKAKSCGGRMATRRIDDFKFDHGAQFIKKSEASQRWIEIWNQAEVLQKFSDDSSERFCAKSGLTQLPKALAGALNINYNQKLIDLTFSKDHWHLNTEDGSNFKTKNVIMTSPLPQSLEILKKSNIAFDLALEKMIYAKALVILIEAGAADLTSPSYEEKIGNGLFSICSQSAKTKTNGPSWTVVMDPDFSQNYFDEPDAQILAEACRLIKLQRPYLEIKKAHLKKWRYSHPLSTWPKPFENVQPGLYLAGDAFGGPSLVGALRSSKALFDTIR